MSETLTYLTPNDAAPKRNEAVARIREIIAGRTDLFGAEAVEFKPGAVVLLVLTYSPIISAHDLDMMRPAILSVAEALQVEGVRAVCCMFPKDVSLSAFEVSDTAR